jgi:hypothetical protein
MKVEVVNHEYSTHPHYIYFNHMIIRAEELGLAYDFTRCLESFNKWLEVMGQIPLGMKVPTVGRYDHKKGYIFDKDNNRWNFRWESKSDNSRESAFRMAPEVRSKAGRIGGRKAVDLGKTRFQTATSEQQTEWSRKAVASPNHISKLDSNPMKTGIVQRAAANSLNHNTKQVYTCPHCTFTGKGPVMFRRHFDNCKRRVR